MPATCCSKSFFFFPGPDQGEHPGRGGGERQQLLPSGHSRLLSALGHLRGQARRAVHHPPAHASHSSGEYALPSPSSPGAPRSQQPHPAARPLRFSPRKGHNQSRVVAISPCNSIYKDLLESGQGKMRAVPIWPACPPLSYYHSLGIRCKCGVSIPQQHPSC